MTRVCIASFPLLILHGQASQLKKLIPLGDRVLVRRVVLETKVWSQLIPARITSPTGEGRVCNNYQRTSGSLRINAFVRSPLGASCCQMRERS